jgi:hypothetical protein
MEYQIRKVDRVRLRDLKLDERWLQDQVEKDPSLLGLGSLQVFRRERSQKGAGRIDFILRDPASEVRYTVELMLGALDPDHIVRAIEYWDLERQRYPDFEHRAVIVAEAITGRFFNIVRLLNRAVPMLAIQLEAFRIDDSVALHAVTVLDLASPAEAEPDDTGGQEGSRATWESYSSKASLAVADGLLRLVGSVHGAPRVKYNQQHIAVGTSGYNFLWLVPVAKASHCSVEVRVAPADRAGLAEALDSAGIATRTSGDEYLKLTVMPRDLEAGATALKHLLEAADRASRDSGVV